jgi:hypothetical protein
MPVTKASGAGARRLVDRAGHIVDSAVFAAALLFLASLPAAARTAPCDKTASFAYAAPTLDVLVSGVAGQRIYPCGFTVMQKGPALDFQLSTGTGPSCSLAKNNITPVYSVPNDFAVVSRIERVGPSSAVGESLCIQTFGSGNLSGVVYYAQF